MTRQSPSKIGAPATAVVTRSFLSVCSNFLTRSRRTELTRLCPGAMMSLSLMAVPTLLDTTTEPSQLFYQWVPHVPLRSSGITNNGRCDVLAFRLFGNQ